MELWTLVKQMIDRHFGRGYSDEDLMKAIKMVYQAWKAGEEAEGVE